MGALSCWYIWSIGIRKKWKILIFKKGRFSRVAQIGPFSASLFWGVPTLSSNFSVISWSILKILVPILVQISWILWNTPSFLNFDVFEWSYGRNKENLQFRNWRIWATPENLPFLKMKFIHFFLIPMDQKYQNESAPIFCYAKSTKTA